MTSDLLTNPPVEAFVWIWLPDAMQPVVCGRLDEGTPVTFTYARSYLARTDAVPVFEPELPLRSGIHEPVDGQRLPLSIDDAMPDAWGRRLVNDRLGAGYAELPELTYLLASGSDRFGALDFQASSTQYVPRIVEEPTLEELTDAARHIEAGEQLSPRLKLVLLRGTSIGGARPKALIQHDGTSMIAKFSSTTDTYPVMQGEYLAMALAGRCGLTIAPVELVQVAGRFVLLVERFDRPGKDRRRRVVSALTVLGLSSFPSGRYATYTALTHKIRSSFANPDATLRELFGRISFNILSGNTDDHGRNHAAFIEDNNLVLTPAYDICPQARSGGRAAQAMAYGADERDARVAPLIASARGYHLDEESAKTIAAEQEHIIRTNWDEVCDEARLTKTQRKVFFGGQFLNPYAFET